MTSGNGKQDHHPTQFSLSRGRALLLDDDKNNLQHFTTLLERMAYVVRAFTNYQEAERYLDHEPFDFIVVSPAFEAHPQIELTLARNRHMPEVVLTRCLEMNCCVAVMQLGAPDYFEKPLTPTEFEHLLTTHCPPRHGESSARISERLTVRRGGSPSHRSSPLQCGDGGSLAPSE
ncbi:MAG: response regulator [Terriglobia bacterium]